MPAVRHCDEGYGWQASNLCRSHRQVRGSIKTQQFYSRQTRSKIADFHPYGWAEGPCVTPREGRIVEGREGVSKVNPVYTSVIGPDKFRRRYGPVISPEPQLWSSRGGLYNSRRDQTRMAAMAPPACLHGVAAGMDGRFGHGLFAKSGVCNARSAAQKAIRTVPDRAVRTYPSGPSRWDRWSRIRPGTSFAWRARTDKHLFVV